MLAVFLRTLSKRSHPRPTSIAEGEIKFRERSAFRGYFLRILGILSVKCQISDDDGVVDVVELLGRVVRNFGRCVAQMAVNLTQVDVAQHEAQELNLGHLQPSAVVTSLNRDLHVFWPDRRWKEEEGNCIQIPSAEDAAESRLFIDMTAYNVEYLGNIIGPAVDWTQFGVPKEPAISV